MAKSKPPTQPHADLSSNSAGSSAHATVKETAAPEEMTQEELLNKVIEYGNLSKRLAADYQNLQRETEERMQRMQKYATEQLILEIVPLLDYFNSAFAAIPEAERNSNWLQGIQHIRSQLMNILQQHQVEVIDAIGQPFNSELHEAVSEEVSDQPADTILRQTQVGVKLNGKIIKPAKVILSKGASELPESAAEETEQVNN